MKKAWPCVAVSPANVAKKQRKAIGRTFCVTRKNASKQATVAQQRAMCDAWKNVSLLSRESAACESGVRGLMVSLVGLSTTTRCLRDR